MKKTSFLVGLALAVSVVFGPVVFADNGVTTTNAGQDQSVYHANVPSTPIWENRQFWQNEKQRSGLPNFWENTKHFFKSINPGPWLNDQRQKYEERRQQQGSMNTADRTNVPGTSNTNIK